MIILDGKKLSEKILSNLKKRIKKQLKLAVVLVGDNPVSQVYIRQKKEACQKIGIDFELFKFPSKISRTKLKKEIEEIVKKPKVSGVIIQLPLPKDFNSQEFLNLIPLEKDIDVLSSASRTLAISPPVVEGIKRLLKEYKISIKDKKIVLVGAGRLVGKPLSIWLAKQEADFSLVDKSLKDISQYTKNADIIISGAGSPNLIKEEMIKRGVVLIDAGTSSEKGKIVGDIDSNAYKKASYVAPVPEGVGPMTVACLLDNLVKLNTK